MKAFRIDSESNITAFTSRREIPERGEGTAIFSSSDELSKLAETWPGARLIEIWNSLPGVVPVRRFTNRKVAVTRIWNSIQHLQLAVRGGVSRMAPNGPLGKRQAGIGARPPAREKSKTASVIALLRKPRGATLQAIMRATGWQAHTVRGFISGKLGKKLGLPVRSDKRDGERIYIIEG
jgi:hypothetical protein